MNPVSPYRKGTTTMHPDLRMYLQMSPPGRLLCAVADALTGTLGHDPDDVFVSYNRHMHATAPAFEAERWQWVSEKLPDTERVQITLLERHDRISEDADELDDEYADHCDEECDDDCEPEVNKIPEGWHFRHRTSHTLTFDTSVARAWAYDTREQQQIVTTNTDPRTDYGPELTARYAGEIAQFLHDKATGGQS